VGAWEAATGGGVPGGEPSGTDEPPVHPRREPARRGPRRRYDPPPGASPRRGERVTGSSPPGAEGAEYGGLGVPGGGDPPMPRVTVALVAPHPRGRTEGGVDPSLGGSTGRAEGKPCEARSVTPANSTPSRAGCGVGEARGPMKPGAPSPPQETGVHNEEGNMS